MNNEKEIIESDIKDFEGDTGETFVKGSPAENSTPEKAEVDSPAPRRRPRIGEIDFLRGFCVLLMIFDHIMYDFAYIFGGRGGLWGKAPGYAGSAAERISQFAVRFWNSGLRATAEPMVVCVFVFLSGISSGLSRSNLNRGLKLAFFAELLTLVTYILNGFIPGTVIWFGILQMFAVSMIVFGLIELALRQIRDGKIYKYTSLAVYTAVGIVCLAIGYSAAPATSVFGSILVKGWGFSSADYFPLLPWMGYMFLGAVFGRIVYADKKSLLGKYNEGFQKYTAPVSFVGKKAAWFYLLHQIFIFGLLYVFGLIAGF